MIGRVSIINRTLLAALAGVLLLVLAACSNTQQGTIINQSLSGLGDFVWHDANMDGIQDPDEEGVDGVTVRLYNCSGDLLAEGNTGEVIQAILFGTIGDGNYSFAELLSQQAIDEGLDTEDIHGNTEPCYVVEVVLPDGYVFSPQDQGSDDEVDSDVDPTTGRTVPIYLPKAGVDFTWDAGIYMEQQNGEGCTPGYWKNHEDSWAPTAYLPAQSVQSVFTAAAAYPAQGSASLLEALDFGGGPRVEGAVKILLRAAVASLLNASHPDVSFDMSVIEVIVDVDAALASGDRDTMLELANYLDGLNNSGCDLN